MTKNTIAARAGSRLTLDARMLVENAPALVQALQARRGAALEIDASEVAEIGTPCVQALMSAVVSWRSDGHAVAVVDPSPEFMSTIAHLGVRLDQLGAGGVGA